MPLLQPATRANAGPHPPDGHEHLPRGAIGVSPPRELLAQGSSECAFEPDGSIAEDTIRDPTVALGYGLLDLPTVGRPTEQYDGDALWVGDLRDHFGHFLTESVTRFWPLVAGHGMESIPAVARLQGGDCSPFLAEWLDGFGAEMIYLQENRTVRFRRMHVPERCWRIHGWIAPEVRDTHLHARRAIEPPAGRRHDLLWLSRSGLKPDRAAIDESLLEWILRDHVTSVHLETLSLEKQILLLEGSRAVAGVMGSAFHGLLMTVNTPDALYLCPSFARHAYVAQHRLLDGNAAFVSAVLPEAGIGRLRQSFFYFPGQHRVRIPEALAAIQSTLLPDLYEDPKIAAFTRLKRDGRSTSLNEIDAAVLEVLREPLSAPARKRLGAIFRERNLNRCASEQLDFAAAISD